RRFGQIAVQRERTTGTRACSCGRPRLATRQTCAHHHWRWFLVWCLRNNYTFAAMDFGRRLGASDEHIPQWICKERATTPPPKRHAALRVALKFAWGFVAPNTAWGKARRGSITAALCDREATKPQAVFGATLRAAVLFASRFVARSSQTAEGYARRSRLAGNENSFRRNTSQLRDTTLVIGLSSIPYWNQQHRLMPLNRFSSVST